MLDLGNVGKSEIKAMVQIYNTLKKNGLTEKGKRVVVSKKYGDFGEDEGLAVACGEWGVQKKGLGNLLDGISWPVHDKTGLPADRIVIPAILDVPYTMWGFAYMYANRGIRWATFKSEGADRVAIQDINQSSDYLALRSHAMPYGTGWKKISVSPGLTSILQGCEYCVQAGSSLSSLSMEGGLAVFSFHTYGGSDTKIPYNSNDTFDGIMESLVQELDTSYRKLDISRVLWYNHDAGHNRGFIKSVGSGEYEFLIV